MTQAMKPCSEPLDFQSYLDHRLTLPERIRLERHVKDCMSCSKNLASFHGTFECLGEKLAPDADDSPKPGEMQRLLETIIRPKLPPKSETQEISAEWIFSWKMLPGLAVTLLLLGLFLRVATPGKKVSTAIETAESQYAFVVDGDEKTGLVKVDVSGDVPRREGRLELESAYKVLAKGRAVIQFSNSRMECQEQTLFIMQTSGTKLLNGKARFLIHPRNSEFAVATPFGVVTCLGTAFVVDVTPKAAFVILEDGKIELASGADRVVQTQPGALYNLSNVGVRKNSSLSGNPQFPVPLSNSSPPQNAAPSRETATSAGSFETSY